MASAHRNEIIIAVIGLVGVVFTAIVSNYDKLLGVTPEHTSISPYENVDDINMQLRYFIEVSGFRDSLEEMEKVTAEKYKLKYGATDTEINCILDNRIQTEQLIELFVETMKNHMTLQQIKDLNRLYSSETMKSYTESSPLIVREFISGIEKLFERMYVRNQAIRRSGNSSSEESCPAG
jgi:hypothetical protein